MTIGDRLREERERLGFNQPDFAAHGVDISYVITGKRQSKAREKYFKDRLLYALQVEPNGGPLTSGLTATIEQLETVYLQREEELHDIELMMLNLSTADFALAKEMVVKIYKASLVK